jgi:hypothetical protein
MDSVSHDHPVPDITGVLAPVTSAYDVGYMQIMYGVGCRFLHAMSSMRRPSNHRRPGSCHFGIIRRRLCVASGVVIHESVRTAMVTPHLQALILVTVNVPEYSSQYPETGFHPVRVLERTKRGLGHAKRGFELNSGPLDPESREAHLLRKNRYT